MEESVEEILAQRDPFHCPNGHLIIVSNNGRGCLKRDCPYRIIGNTPMKPIAKERE